MQGVRSLYIHFPFCRHKCNYCDFHKTLLASPGELNSFEVLLRHSWKKHQKLLGDYDYHWDELDTLYLGGGTPSLWGEQGADFLANFFGENGICLAKDGEFTMEVNPGGWKARGLRNWQDMGINRFSLGVQSLDDKFLRLLDRVHCADEARETLDFFAGEGVDFSVDLMLGLPFSKEKDRQVLRELEEILRYRPAHLSLYILTVSKGYPWFAHLPSERWIEREYLEVSHYLRECGYLHYEVSNFALTGKRSWHNRRYWDCQTVAAIGPSATGFLSEPKVRYKWTTGAPAYRLEKLSPQEFKLERFYMGLRTSQGVALNVQEWERCLPVLRDWQESGLIVDKSNRLVLTPKGFLSMDSLIDRLFAIKVI